ncbi:MAG: metallophosphoesterase [Varibaculum sp.]|nr:metallophosphoesterase [Varibaculum sp.]
MVRTGATAAAILSGIGFFGAATLGGGIVAARHPRLRTCTVMRNRKNTIDTEAAVTKHSIRILQLADLHLSAGREWLVDYVRTLADPVNGARPDLVIATGDNLCDAESLPMVRRALEPFTDLPGCFVFGSNDYYSAVPKSPTKYLTPLIHRVLRSKPSRVPPARRIVPDLPHRELAAFFTDEGWFDLRNRWAAIEVSGMRVALAGVDDPHINRDILPNLRDGWSGADIRIAVSHAPYARVLDAFTRMDADLIVAGHTHGGQLCLPGAHGRGRALVNNTDVPLEYSSGLHLWRAGTVKHPKPRVSRAGRESGSERDSHGTNEPVGGATVSPLHVSAGLGTNKYTPFRVFCPPEANLITLGIEM